MAPSLAHDTAGTVAAARDLHERIDQPNLFVKIPATAEGVPAIRTMIGEGRSINVTLIFSLDRYDEVIEAYVAGLEDAWPPAPRISPACAAWRRSSSAGSTPRSTGGSRAGGRHAATRQACSAPGQGRGGPGPAGLPLFVEKFSGPRWEALAAKGAKVQRRCGRRPRPRTRPTPTCSTSTPSSVPTRSTPCPTTTIADFLDHGTVARTVDAHPDEADQVAGRPGRCSASTWPTWPRTLEDEGVASFAKSFDELMQSLTDKANALSSSS